MTKQLFWLQKISLNSTLVLESSPPAPGLQRRTTIPHGSWCSHWLNKKTTHVIKIKILNTLLIYKVAFIINWLKITFLLTIEQFTIGKFHFIQYQTFLVLWDMFIWKIEMSRYYCEHHREAVTYLLCGFSPWLPCILVRALLQSVLWTTHWSSLSACCDLLQNKKSFRES